MLLALGPLLVPFFAIAVAIILLGVEKAITAQHGSKDTGGFWSFITGQTYLHQVSGLAAKFLRSISSKWAASQIPVIARWLTSMGTLTRHFSAAQANFAKSATAAIQRIEHRGDPLARAKAQTANRHAIHAGHTATHANVHARSVGHALDHYKGRTTPQIRHLVHETTIALPRDIARVKHRERWAEKQLWKVRDRVIGLENGAIKTFEWLRDHPGSAAVGAFTGALAAVLSVAGVNALRCPQFGNLFNKRGCGLWNDLDALLGLLALGLAIDNLETLVKEAQTLEEGVAVAIKEMLGA